MAKSQSRSSGSKRQALVIGGLAVLVLGVTGGALWSIYHSSPASAGVARTVAVARGVVQESVSASGNISPVESENVNFSTGGTVTSLDVSAGEQVKAGQVLATVDPAQAQANLQSAEASLEAAQATLAQDEQGGSSAQLAQNSVSLSQAESQLTTDEQTLSSDQTTVTEAEQQLTADEALGCPPASGSANSASSDNSGSSDSGSGSSGSGSSGSGSGSGSDSGTGSGSAFTASADVAPTATTDSATSVMTTTAQLDGSVGGAGSYWFQYGTTTSYGSTTASESTPGGAVSADVTGLSPDTTYIFRLVASNAAGTTYGSPDFLSTAESSCVVDQQDVTADQQTVERQQATISDQEQSISATEDGQAVQPSTVAAAQAQVAQAQLTVNTDKTAVTGTTLVAPISGTIITLNGTLGESVSGSGDSAASSSSSSGSGSGSGGSGSSGTGSSSSSSSAFLTIENLHQLEVEVDFPEADATNIAVGQPSTITLAALPDTEVAGKVVAVSDVSTVSDNVVYYEETVALDNPPATVRDGMTALVSVIVATASDVLEVPSAAITTTGTFSTVTEKTGNSTEVVRVTLGLVGNSTTQITSGVTLGETLVEPTATVSSTAGSTSTGGGTSRFGGGGGAFTGGGGGGFAGG
jgi:multidrug efflux pump subunit AcrA (membrane-fusion protein)